LAAQLIYGVSSLGNAPKITVLLLLSLAVWLCETGLYCFTLSCFALPKVFPLSALAMSLTNLGILIPSSPGFIGPFHFFCMQALSAFGIQPALALSYAIVVHLAFYIPVTAWGLLVLTVYGFEFASAVSLKQSAQPLELNTALNSILLSV